MSANITFLEGTYRLIHIPLDLYATFLQPILRVLIPHAQSLQLDDQTPLDVRFEGLSSEYQHAFMNISVTRFECSLVCHTSWAEHVFEPVIRTLPPEQAQAIWSHAESYIVLSVASAAELDAPTRVLELTSPLAAAGIPIFFITTYYSDYILAPAHEQLNVIAALHERGFELSESHDNFYVCRRNSTTGGRGRSGSSSPPPFSSEELQSATFELLQTHRVSPHVDPGLELVMCASRDAMPFVHAYARLISYGREVAVRETWIDHVDTKFYAALVSVLVSQPRFVSVTLTQDDPPSLLIDKSLLSLFSNSIVGDLNTVLTPIFLDLVTLPTEVTGIVCVVSGRLVHEMDMKATSELSYLSTARAGVVILPEQQAIQAVKILEPLMKPKEENVES
ncbi:hypothetical protein E4U17_006589 [Claviceps sp. LM77 group G4]|nr:hypothetical protein E4U17_006589 [Claviceps sp. LM77 group G4]KAG6062215.1 hypothetical protein E4U33_006583 [Claviceps sp. LM78 group G4]KAG6070789.1 hypothetical protein E4U16_006610 [Claviceps sp. LM84 group G4]